MTRTRWMVVGVLLLAVAVGIGYTAYVGYEGSRQMVSVDELRSRDCQTPDVLFGWEYEAINYDIADDAALKAANPDMSDCDSQGTKAGTEVVTPDGVHIAGWYVPAANGIGPTGPTVVLMHGFSGNKSGILPLRGRPARRLQPGRHRSAQRGTLDRRRRPPPACWSRTTCGRSSTGWRRPRRRSTSACWGTRWVPPAPSPRRERIHGSRRWRSIRCTRGSSTSSSSG